MISGRFQHPIPLFALVVFLALLALASAPETLAQGARGLNLVRIVSPRAKAREVLLPIHIILQFKPAADQKSLNVLLNGKNITRRFKKWAVRGKRGSDGKRSTSAKISLSSV